MTLRDRVLIVLRGAGQPLSTAQVARILGVETQIISSPISRLVAYGHAEMERVPDGYGRWRGVYRAKVTA